MPTLLELPSEIVTRLFEHSESFSHVLALATACRRLYAIWITNQRTILWTVSHHSVLSFDEALIAARATEIVTQAYRAGTLPPEINLPSLSGTSQRPNVQEIQRVLDLEHLVLCAEYIFLDNSYVGTSWGIYINDICRPSSALDKEIWKLNFHRTFYIFLIAGAILARPYMEPFHSHAEDKPLNFLYQSNENGDNNESSDSDDDEPFSMQASDAEFLKKFPVYQLRDTERCSLSFEHLSEWLLEQSKSRFKQLPEEGPMVKHEYYNNIIEIIQVREVLQILFMYSQMCEHTMFTNKFVSNSDGQIGYLRRQNRHPATFRPHESIRKVTVVFFGIFQPEEITMPAIIPSSYAPPRSQATSQVRLLADRIPRSQPDVGPTIPDIAALLRAVDQFSRRPPQLFSYILEKNFQLRFPDEVTMARDMETPFEMMATHGEIFHKEYFNGGQRSGPLLVDVKSARA